MPDGRRRGAKQYSTHPPTMRTRMRIQRMSPEDREVYKARQAEYNAYYGCCKRVATTENYRKGSISKRRSLLLSTLKSLIAKRYLTLGAVV